MLQAGLCDIVQNVIFDSCLLTGAGNGFLGGLAAGLRLCRGDVFEGIVLNMVLWMSSFDRFFCWKRAFMHQCLHLSLLNKKDYLQCLYQKGRTRLCGTVISLKVGSKCCVHAMGNERIMYMNKESSYTGIKIQNILIVVLTQTLLD